MNRYILLLVQVFKTNIESTKNNLLLYSIVSESREKVYELAKEEFSGISGDRGETYVSMIVAIGEEDDETRIPNVFRFISSYWIQDLNEDIQFKLFQGLISKEVK